MELLGALKDTQRNSHYWIMNIYENFKVKCWAVSENMETLAYGNHRNFQLTRTVNHLNRYPSLQNSQNIPRILRVFHKSKAYDDNQDVFGPSASSSEHREKGK